MKTKQDFEKWLLGKYKGVKMNDCPSNWNKEKEFFYKIGELQYRIQFNDIPKRFQKKPSIW